MEQRRNLIVGIALFAMTMALYWPVTTFPFINYDDQLYVYQNPEVLNGLSWGGIKWALTAIVAANWHPLTLWSHMADCSMFHLFAGGHHLTNILLHSVDVVLLWVLVRRMTHCFWPGVLVAALFAWHPLNVESVAWIAERKNVLSAFFFLLTLLAYLRYAEKPRPGRYLLTLVLFILGLAAKPMLVTLPFLLFLLDYWPLQRIFPSPNHLQTENRVGKPFLILEKVPFLILAGADCLITYLAQNQAGSLSSLAGVPIASRLLNIPVAYVAYLEKTFWPARLCVFYEFPRNPSIVPTVICLFLLTAGTLAAWKWRFRYRWLPVGWLWFLGTLVPAIGLVQTGLQAWADRHAYVPLIGIFLIVACGLNELWVAKPSFHTVTVLAVSLFLCGCLVLTRQQLGCWRSSIALFTQAVAVNPDSAVAQNQLGKAYNGDGQSAEAIEHFADAVRLKPQNAEYQYNLGRGLLGAGRFGEAEDHLTAALKQTPDDPALHNTLGVALMQLDKPREAENEFGRAIALQADYSKAYLNLGKALLKEGQTSSAITNLVMAARLDPGQPEALESLAAACAAAGNISNAISTANLALKMAQTNRLQPLAEQIARELDAYQSKLAGKP